MKNDKLTEESRQKWLKIMINEMMSSEDSGDDDAMIVHPIPWRSDYVNKMFHNIDKYYKVRKSAQACRQTKQRTVGSLSNRRIPTDVDIIFLLGQQLITKL